MAIECTRKGGAITLVGNLAPNVELPLQAVVTREIIGIRELRVERRVPRVHRISQSRGHQSRSADYCNCEMEEGPAWFERLYAGEPGAMKVILQPSGAF